MRYVVKSAGRQPGAAPQCFRVPGFWLCVVGCLVGAVSADDVQVQIYLNEIKPLLRANCYACHGPLKQEAGLRLDSGRLIRQGGDSGSVVDLDDVNNSLILQRISAADEAERMPPEGDPLTARQISRLRGWIAGGAQWPLGERAQQNPREHWAFQPIDEVSTPDSDNANPIDAFVRRRLKRESIDPAPPAAPYELVRRMFLDLHGLPPTPAELQRWRTKITRDPGSVSELADFLLSSPRYGERWAQHWLDVVRYADTHGFEVNTARPHAWRYRDYVIQALNDDKPYDQFVFEQLAGDSEGEDAATGFLVAAPVLLPGQIGKDEASKRLARQDSLDEIIVGTSATFLGLTIGCARCHDHKFDPITQKEYYAMQAFFAGVEYGDRRIYDETEKSRQVESRKLAPQIEKLKVVLRRFEPAAFAGRTLIIDDEDMEHVSPHKTKIGHGANPEGTQRGYKNDTGSADRYANLSQGRYTHWNNVAGEDVLSWRPRVAGRYRTWISWGLQDGKDHTSDARYLVDRDGDLETKHDQTEIARIDQRRFADNSSCESEFAPLWSGLKDVGLHDWTKSTRLVLRGGETGAKLTADVIVLQEAAANDRWANLPLLRDPVNPVRNIERFAPISAKFLRFTVLQTIDDNLHEPCIDELEIFGPGDSPVNVAGQSDAIRLTSSGNYSETGIHQIKHINDGKFGNSHSWISNEKGGGWIQFELPEAKTIDCVAWGRDREGEFKDRLAVKYHIDVSLDGKIWTTVARSEDRVSIGTPVDRTRSLVREARPSERANLPTLLDRLESLQRRKAKLDEPKLAYAGKFREPDKTHLLHRGDPEQPQDEVQAQIPRILGKLSIGNQASEQQRRIALARWMTDPSNPLTARVMVNRIWQHHFGSGLVDSASDFGLSAARPSHPELLDWLAGQFVKSGWSVKAIHRLILSSETFQQSSRIDPRAQSVDGDCRLFWRFPSRRLEAESIRDCMLHVSGELNLQMYGPGFDFFKARGGLSGFPPVQSFSSAELRRMIYAHKIRMEPVPVFGAFDCPDAGQPMPQRGQSTTPVQTLNLFNSEFVIDQAAKFASRLKSESPQSIDKQIVSAFYYAFGREPTASEQTASNKVVTEHGLTTLCRVMFNSNEFLFMP